MWRGSGRGARGKDGLGEEERGGPGRWQGFSWKPVCPSVDERPVEGSEPASPGLTLLFFRIIGVKTSNYPGPTPDQTVRTSEHGAPSRRVTLKLLHLPFSLGTSRFSQ